MTAERLSRFLTEVDFENQSASEQQAAYISVLSATRDLATTFSLSSSGENGRKRARKDKPAKDPDAPKKPITAYMIYQGAQREAMSAAHPDMQYKDILKLIGQDWKALTDAEKAVCFWLPFIYGS